MDDLKGDNEGKESEGEEGQIELEGEQSQGSRQPLPCLMPSALAFICPTCIMSHHCKASTRRRTREAACSEPCQPPPCHAPPPQSLPL